MNSLRKIPLEGLIQILTDLFDTGVDFIDISGQQDDREDGPVDVIKITVRPEYISNDDENDDEDDIKIKVEEIKPNSLSEEDINDLL